MTEVTHVKHNNVTFELREKGNWKWYHLYMALGMWIVGVFSKKTKRKWYYEYWTTAWEPFKKRDHMTLYGPVGRWRTPSSLLLAHEARHSNAKTLPYLLSPSYRLAEELDAYEVQLRAEALRSGRVSSVTIEHLTDELYGMYFLWPFMKKMHVRLEVVKTVYRVENRIPK